MARTRQFCTFFLDQLLFGVELARVQEVIRHIELTEIPLAPPAISGLLNLRGQIVTGIDLRASLKLPPRPLEKRPVNVVIRGADGAMCLLVDEIGDVAEVTEDCFERPPETLQGMVRKAITGVYKLDQQLLHVLDTDRACEIAESLAAPESGNDPVVGSRQDQGGRG